MFSHRIIADHLRSTSFLIADGVLPSNEGRGYVLRRIMRRGMRHAHLLGTKDPLMHRLVPTLVAEMGAAYPELKRAEALIAETLKLEEIRFRETLARGLKLLDEATLGMKARATGSTGDVAFKLYDTYGFPLDLTQESLRARGIAVDQDGFTRDGKAARRSAQGLGRFGRSRQRSAMVRRAATKSAAPNFSATTPRKPKATSWRIFKDGERVQSATAGETVQILTNQTPFYAESGGQVGRHRPDAVAPRPKARSIDTQKKLGALHVHVVEGDQGRVRGRRCRGSEGGPRTPPRHPRQSLRHPSAACRAEARAGHPCQPEGLAGRRPSGCASISPIPSR